MPLAPTVKLNNGVEMPILGLGTYKSVDDDVVQVMKYAIDEGYRHFDTALFYGNETQVGQAVREKIADGTVKREEIFVVTKLWGTYHEPSKVEDGCRISLRNLGLDYIDLFLMHSPMSTKYNGDGTALENFLPKNAEGNFQFTAVDYVDTWKAMEGLVEKGLVKSIGVSNFNSEQLERVLKEGTIKPVTNQIECNPTINQKKLTKFCKDRGVTVTAYAPLGKTQFIPDGPIVAKDDDRVIAIGRKYGKTPVQVILRFLVQLGTMPIPKSAKKERVRENINIFDFQLTDEEMSVMEGMNTGQRTTPLAIFAKNKNYPFTIEF